MTMQDGIVLNVTDTDGIVGIITNHVNADVDVNQ